MAVVSKMERKSEDKATNPIYVSNLVVYCEDNNEVYVVLVTDTQGINHTMFETFEGVVVFDERGVGEVGKLDNTFVKSSFKQFEGTITLTGSK